MKLFLVAALCALLAAQVAARITLPPDDLGVDTTDILNNAGMTSLFARWAIKFDLHSLANNAKALVNFHSAVSAVKLNRAAVAAGTANVALALNEFAHMSFPDFMSTRLGRRSGAARKSSTTVQVPALPRVKRGTPAVNWTALGYVTAVQNQGNCGSCWAFSATGAIEGAYFKAKKQLISFSPEEFIECVPPWQGCDGGVEDDAFNYVQSNKGQDTLTSYPYIAGLNGNYSTTCLSKPAPSRVAMNLTWGYLNPGDTTLLNAILTVGPLSVSIAVGDPFMLYSSGVMNSTVACGSGLNHAVLLTGVGMDNATGRNYWLVKNSWGAGWGERGYFRLDRAIPDACGITEMPYIVLDV